MCCGPDLTADNWDRKFETIAWLCEFSESKRACPSSAVVMSEATEHWVAPLDVSGSVGNREKGNGAEASVAGRSLSMEARREKRGLISLVDIQIQASMHPTEVDSWLYLHRIYSDTSRMPSARRAVWACAMYRSTVD